MSRSNCNEAAERMVLVKSVCAAAPEMTQERIAAQLGMKRATVAYYLTRRGGKLKTPSRLVMPWAGLLTEACFALKEKRNDDAARSFYELAQMLACKS